MHSVSLDQAKQEFDAVVARVLSNAEPTIVRTPSGDSVVVVPLGDFEAWRETAYLLRTPANAAHLRSSIAEAEAGNVDAHDLAE
jgi:antitoxin YefM